MSRNVPTDFQNTLYTRRTTVSMCWKVERKDGVILGFTDHDKPLTIDSVVYEAVNSFSASAIIDQLGLSVSNLEAMGALSSDAITDQDLRDGRYDGANVTIFLVNAADVTQNVIIKRGTLGQIMSGDLSYQAELRGLAQAFAQHIGSLSAPKCRSPFGDTSKGLSGGCRFTLPAPITGTVSAITSRKVFTISAAGGPFAFGAKGSTAMGYFAFGTCTFTSGANSGIAREIQDSSTTPEITTILPFPEDIQIGDAVSLQIGCDHTVQTCKVNYNNLVNFRGEPYVSGTDQALRVQSESVF